jgi:hypothetical protein
LAPLTNLAGHPAVVLADGFHKDGTPTIQRLDDGALSRAAQILRDRELDSQMSSLIDRVARRKGAPDLSDVDLDREIHAHRWSRSGLSNAPDRR